ncbi:hypothetical protein, partial [Xanthomonas citri]|uniref:hypothetical protein n=1 Tax=Xanthomonas citri TaxID=346 RepID=UPI001E380E27
AGGIRVLPTLRPTGLAQSPQDSCSVPNLERGEVADERWKRRFIWQLHVFKKEIGFCESFLHVCRLNPTLPRSSQLGTVRTLTHSRRARI